MLMSQRIHAFSNFYKKIHDKIFVKLKTQFIGIMVYTILKKKVVGKIPKIN
jgi:hypothetical protein